MADYLADTVSLYPSPTARLALLAAAVLRSADRFSLLCLQRCGDLGSMESADGKPLHIGSSRDLLFHGSGEHW